MSLCRGHDGAITLRQWRLQHTMNPKYVLHSVAALAFSIAIAMPAMAEEITVPITPGLIVSGDNISAAFPYNGTWYAVPTYLTDSHGNRYLVAPGMAEQLIVRGVLSQFTPGGNIPAKISLAINTISPCVDAFNPTYECVVIEGVR